MSNMQADIYLLRLIDVRKLTHIEEYLAQDMTVFFVHVTHVCPFPNHSLLRRSHVKLVVYSDMFYQQLLAMVIGANADTEPGHYTEEVRLDNSAALIGYCVCHFQTQGDIATFEMS